jgi:diguanylate cyclase
MFKHDQSALVHSSRHASRRLQHRSFAMRLFGQARAVVPTASGHTRVRDGGMSRPAEVLVDLLAAEARIGELEEALSEARAAAFTDALTGALNRRGFEDAYRREVARARRHGSRLALALIDLDDFKRLNDTLGHQAGDEALVHLVMELRAALRPSDILCRFGGEEFVVLLPETALPEAAAAISRFQRQFAANAVPGRDVVVTFSAGVVLHELTESLADSMVRADTATYAAKRAGKNCVVTA